ncbi:hypothetical protein JTE90_021178 [Oedothorax gibbosus]|uniref:Uncharacterized protein n=1 Tax=Oedothorax gibbosus TaxID=931172 RepID=A0AAV6V7E8_9ARAC|nr:hypothetical protein JTE90_021178 [Oedothorax gibbosus]
MAPTKSAVFCGGGDDFFREISEPGVELFILKPTKRLGRRRDARDRPEHHAFVWFGKAAMFSANTGSQLMYQHGSIRRQRVQSRFQQDPNGIRLQ